MKLAPLDRLREEDPFTGQAIVDVPTHVIAHVSRFEFDLNRAADEAIYQTPEQSLGPRHLARADSRTRCCRTGHATSTRAYYRMLGRTCSTTSPPATTASCCSTSTATIIAATGRAARRPIPSKAPDINIGTFSMPREQWADLIDPLIEAMAGFDFNGRRLDVRENIAFQGKGEQTRFVHERYPKQGCAIAIEFKKFFMDEWSGEPDPAELDAMRRFIAFTAATARELIE